MLMQKSNSKIKNVYELYNSFNSNVVYIARQNQNLLIFKNLYQEKVS